MGTLGTLPSRLWTDPRGAGVGTSGRGTWSAGASAAAEDAGVAVRRELDEPDLEDPEVPVRVVWREESVFDFFALLAELEVAEVGSDLVAVRLR